MSPPTIQLNEGTGAAHKAGSLDSDKPPGTQAASGDIPHGDVFHERLNAIEGKFDLISTMFGVQGPVDKSVHDSDTESSSYDSDSSDRQDQVISDLLWALRRVKRAYTREVKLKERRKRLRRATKTETRPVEPESLKQISMKALLENRPARVLQVDWDLFMKDKGEPENSALAPIDAVIGKTEPNVILQLTTRDRNPSRTKPPSHRPLDRDTDFANADPSMQRALPERIKIHSSPLLTIMDEVSDVSHGVAPDGSMVYLRPFRELYFYARQLGEKLADLERSFESYKTTVNEASSMAIQDVTAANISAEKSAATSSVDHGADQHVYDQRSAPSCRDANQGDEVEEPDVGKNSNEDTPTYPTALLHLRCLMGFIRTEILAKSQYIGSRDCRKLTFQDLWYLFQPGHETLVNRGRLLQGVAKFKFKPMYYMGTTLDTRDEIDSQVVVDFNEALANETKKHWRPTIAPINPARDHDYDDVCMAACCRSQVVHDDSDVDSRLTEAFVKTLIPDNTFGAPSLILSPRPLDEITSDENGPTEGEFVLMTYRVFGFVLRSRKWAQLDLTFLRYENVDARNTTLNAFDRLELLSGHREMVKSLVTQHFRHEKARDEQTDLVKGKGKAQILLLHGAPGVGKTTTAEGVAERFKRPLFRITCGDLGTTAKEVESELEKNFALASRWGCILLLDEADVFLSARERKDFARNGLVAEYYAGILFLTTNRLGDIDEAFASRIHMSLFYPELDEIKTRKIFKLNLDLTNERFKRQGRVVNYDPSSIQTFARNHFVEHPYNRWDGRQIRNACQTALALAEFDAHGGKMEGDIDVNVVVELQLKYFEIVQSAYLDFGHYLGDIRGTQGDRRAIDYGLRARTETPYQTTPSRFSRKAEEFRSTAKGTGSIPPKPEYQGEPFQFQLPVNQGYSMGSIQNMGPFYGQYPQQAQLMGPTSMGYERQQSQTDPRLFQGQQGQGWGSTPSGMNFNLGAQALHNQAQYVYNNSQQGLSPHYAGVSSPDTSVQTSQHSIGSWVDALSAQRPAPSSGAGAART
ncbi:Uu.00g010390.m01.CDS01 [Anthostomella pinea]|uniref:Uu.00g010390.m01.CDS01 n=1 Tax=Anthostomella pinea TaxID=933095 RepID=A0AAI8YQ28_9PEZI|nr:Uu.00g010390.m01.CDS01 [Anthostomella pinea]